MVTQARRSLSDDISYRQRRYLLMMGIRAVCFVIAIVMFINHLGWLAAIPAVGAIVIPYFAVVFANGGREPNNTRGFMEYNPNLPARRQSVVPPTENGSRPMPPDGGGVN
jgi:O-antigen/teichoic acid export membrane protein